MKWKEAAELSPEGLASREHRPGQQMYKPLKGRAYMHQKPNYALYRDCRGKEATGHTDWEPEGNWNPRAGAFVTEGPNEHKCGYLSPDGIFYPCLYAQHLWLAAGLAHKFHIVSETTPDDALLDAGWMMLNVNGWHGPGSYRKELEPTQRQRDRVWDWMQVDPELAKKRMALPWWWEDLKGTGI